LHPFFLERIDTIENTFEEYVVVGTKGIDIIHPIM